MSKIKRTVRKYLRCIECGEVFVIYRRIGHNRKKNHIKNLYCYKCKKVTQHRELN
jgi:hypothetical protein